MDELQPVSQQEMPVVGTKLARLKPSFSSIEYSNRMELILAIRASRRISKKVVEEELDSEGNPIKKQAKPRKLNTKKRAPTKADARNLLSALTPEQAAELLALFETKGE